jgi:hypothetical protein
MIVSNINKKLMKPAVRFEMGELRRIWTDVEKDKRAKEQISSQSSIKEINA